jgi:hypothetical protein
MAKKSFSEQAAQSVAIPQKLKDLVLTVPDMEQRVEHLRTSDQPAAPIQLAPVFLSTPPEPDKRVTTKVGGMIALDIADRMKMIAFKSKVSESGILEMALRSFFSNQSDAEIGMRLRANGARRRRAFSK